MFVDTIDAEIAAVTSRMAERSRDHKARQDEIAAMTKAADDLARLIAEDGEEIERLKNIRSVYSPTTKARRTKPVAAATPDRRGRGVRPGLTASQLATMRSRAGKTTLTALSREFGVSRGTVKAVVDRTGAYA